MRNKILSLVLALVMLVSTFAATSVSTAADVKFDDVTNPSHWSYGNIMYVAENGIMNGVGGGLFAPGMTMTRAQVVRALYNLAGAPSVKYTAAFSDVAAGAWYTEAVIWAVEKGITAGAGDGKFAPDRKLTRGELAMFMYKYAENVEYIDTTDKADISGYADYADVPSYFVDAMSWINGESIMVGVTEDKLAPKMEATREQFARIVNLFDVGEYDYKLVYNAPVYGQNYTAPEYELVEDADIYVSTTGSDDAEGTKEAPIRTFAEAKERVRALLDDETVTGEIKVAFFAGEYGSLDNLTFESADSGTAEQPITYCAYGDGEVVFRNGVQILGSEFEPITDEEAKLFSEEAVHNIYKVDLSGIIDEFSYNNLLFGGSGPCIEARFPNEDDEMPYFNNATTRGEIPEGGSPADIDTLIITTPWVATKYVNKFATYEGLKMTGYLRTGWFQDTFSVKSYDASTKTITLDLENWNLDGSAYQWGDEEYPLAYEGRMNDTIYFHNLAEFLDHDNEYWFDNDTATLYVYNPKGDYAVSDGGTFVTFDYDSEYINIVGLEFNATSSNAINCWGSNISFDLCKIGNVGGTAAIFGDYISEKNEFGDGEDYLRNSTESVSVTNSEIFAFVCGGVVLRTGTHGDGNYNLYTLTSSDILIDNNYFHDFGLEKYFEAAVAVQLYETVGVQISHNEFVNGSHGAVRYDASVDTIIEYNVFDNMMMNTQDFGAVYTWEDITFRDNIIRYNLFTGMRQHDGVHGIYFDGSYGDIVYGNLFYNAGGDNVLLNGGRDNQVYSNISISYGQDGKFITNIDHSYNYINGNGNSGHIDELSYLANKPEEGDEGYDEWYRRWKILYEYSLDEEDYGEELCVFTMINTVTDNMVIGSEFYSGETFERFSTVERNRLYDTTENPCFADPTHGDYTIVNTDGFTEVFPFDEIGRK